MYVCEWKRYRERKVVIEGLCLCVELGGLEGGGRDDYGIGGLCMWEIVGGRERWKLGSDLKVLCVCVCV